MIFFLLAFLYSIKVKLRRKKDLNLFKTSSTAFIYIYMKIYILRLVYNFKICTYTYMNIFFSKRKFFFPSMYLDFIIRVAACLRLSNILLPNITD